MKKENVGKVMGDWVRWGMGMFLLSVSALF
jgi:hypothetical protein